MMQGSTIVDAIIIHATPSTKNKEGMRDPEMHQTKKGKQWCHGMKVPSGVNCGSDHVHTITGTAANVHDIALFRDDDEVFTVILAILVLRSVLRSGTMNTCLKSHSGSAGSFLS